MKLKFLCMVVIAFLISPATTYAVDEYGQYSEKEKKEFRKKAEKAAKTEAKEKKKNGWELNGSGTLEDAIAYYLLQTERYGGPCVPTEGSANNVKSISLGNSKAFMDAANSFAKEQRMALKEKVKGSNSDIDNQQAEIFIEAFEGRVAEEIKGDLKKSYSIVRKNSNGTFDVKIFYLVNEKSSARAMKRALEEASEREDINQAIGDKISEFLEDD